MVGISHLHILNGTFKEVGMDIAEGHDIFKGHSRIRVHQLMLHQADFDSGHTSKMLVEKLLNRFC